MKEFDYIKETSRIRREEEIKLHGKQISFRKGGVHKSKKDYKRNNKINITNL